MCARVAGGNLYISAFPFCRRRRRKVYDFTPSSVNFYLFRCPRTRLGSLRSPRLVRGGNSVGTEGCTRGNFGAFIIAPQAKILAILRCYTVKNSLAPQAKFFAILRCYTVKISLFPLYMRKRGNLAFFSIFALFEYFWAFGAFWAF